MTSRQSNCLIAREGRHVVGGIGFSVDPLEKTLRGFRKGYIIFDKGEIGNSTFINLDREASSTQTSSSGHFSVLTQRRPKDSTQSEKA